MIEKMNLDEECEFFTAERLDEIVILRLKEDLLFRATDLSVRDKVLDYLERVSRTDSIKVVVIISSPKATGSEEYFDFYHRVLTSKFDDKYVHRLHNVFAQIILRIVDLNKIVVHANSGRVISLFLNVSLACDYRIVADDTVFQNPYFKLGLVPIGGGAFFLSRRLGRSKALEILLADKDITADEAKKLGIVDKVVPQEELEKAAVDTARYFAQKPARSLAGLKKLINYSLMDLKDYMALEYQELIKAIGGRLY
ncbi:MAG TPA: enoyl-CoA hydratase/isomerase family protein [Desulfobacterales bacterium]|nr:enoyl-CoA hydratase/isomerase family protein [Desulfobacterales bacterium]